MLTSQKVLTSKCVFMLECVYVCIYYACMYLYVKVCVYVCMCLCICANFMNSADVLLNNAKYLLYSCLTYLQIHHSLWLISVAFRARLITFFRLIELNTKNSTIRPQDDSIVVFLMLKSASGRHTLLAHTEHIICIMRLLW